MDSDEETIHDSHERITKLILSSGSKKDEAVIKYLKDSHFPPVKDFRDGLEWFNVSEPLTFSKHLKGKLVLLDFFTYCCINCMHILPELKELENEFSVEDGLVVIGVHSAKFDNEKRSRNILAAVQRYNIAHPVVNDSTSDMWRKCDVHCWPTLLLLGPDARPLVMLMGEGHKAELQLYIGNALKYYRGQGLISTHGMPLAAANHLLPELKGPLLFPGKLALHATTLAISDSGNHRILLVNTQTNHIVAQIGKRRGFVDGPFDLCEFSAPQGLCFRDADTLYVADTENHAIRLVDLRGRVVVTVAGTGVQGEDRKGGLVGREQVISSPWDVLMYKHEDKDVLLIAMAGTHQIWALFPVAAKWWRGAQHPAGACVCIAGSGCEENRNNQYPMSAAFAQPSGLALNGTGELYVADSEGSTVRRVEMGAAGGRVTAVVGGDRNPNNLFAFGDIDGSLYDAKLQHALGLAMHSNGETLFVADTYNHKIKLVDVTKNTVTSLKAHSSLDDAKSLVFNEPAGLVLSNNTLYVADTNNHCIKIVQLTDDLLAKSVSVLELKSETNDRDTVDKNDMCTITSKTALKISETGGKIVLKVSFSFEEGLKLTENVPQSWEVDLPNLLWSSTPSNGKNANEVEVVISVPSKTAANSFIDIEFNLITCTEESCYPKNFVIRKSVTFERNCANFVKDNVCVKLTPENVFEH